VSMSREIDEFQASALRAVASAHRLRLIHLLGRGPREVHELADALEISQTAASQHLAALRAVGLVEATRDGRTVQYRLADPDVLAACALMRDVLVRRLTRLGRLAASADDIRPTSGPRRGSPNPAASHPIGVTNA
jgi:ArsR family transcriptional regulator, virulence genes transcriptional regulator